MKKTLTEGAEYIQMLITSFISQYYWEYYPKRYDRTGQFLESCVRSEIYFEGKSAFIDIYIDYQDLHYKIKNPYQVVKWANQGLHGGYDPNVDHPEIFVRYTHFWDDAMEVLDEGRDQILEDFVEWIKDSVGCDVEIY